MPKSDGLDGIGIGSKKQLEIVLSRLEGFHTAKVRVEQYSTPADIAAEILWSAHMLGDIGNVGADLGSGPGILGIGLLLLGSKKVYFVDSDETALKAGEENASRIKSEHSWNGDAIWVHKDISEFNEKTDLVVQNPPFGTKVRHADRAFLEKAMGIAPIIFSFHKSETIPFVRSLSGSHGFGISRQWDFAFPLKATLSFHKKKVQRINVSCVRLVKA